MAIEAIIKRRVQQGQQAKQLVPLLMQLRAKAVQQPGYLSSETLSNIDNPEECIVISRWQTIEDWNAWVTSETRAAIQAKIDAIAGSDQEIKVYAPMVLRPG
jgi:heme-degrading monooxygenase HmoA